MYEIIEEQRLILDNPFTNECIVHRELAVSILYHLEHRKTNILYRHTAVGMPHELHTVALEQAVSEQTFVFKKFTLTLTRIELKLAVVKKGSEEEFEEEEE